MATADSKLVEIRRIDEAKGRGLFATQLVKAGDALCEEEPLISSQFLWNEAYKYKACELCMRSLETAQEICQRLTNNVSLVLPHPECCRTKTESYTQCPQCQILYCSADCRDRAWSLYHRALCIGQPESPDHPLVKLEETWRNIHYPPETSSIRLLAKLVAMVKQANDRSVVMNLVSQFTKTTINEEEQIAHKLLGKEFQDQLELLRSMFSEALFEEDLSHFFTPEGFRSLFALVGTNGQGIGTSALSVWVHNCDDLDVSSEDRVQLDAFIDQLYVNLENVSGNFLNCEGSGLYELQSASNHCCVPNAEITFPHNDYTMVMVALQDIEPDQEICISYLDECARERSRHSRQKILRENYLFVCNCSKCLSQVDDPDVTSDEEDSNDEDDMDD